MISIILLNVYDLYHIVVGGKEANIVRRDASPDRTRSVAMLRFGAGSLDNWPGWRDAHEPRG
jgi:hypothetical protein